MYRLIYPTEDVTLAEIARAALAHCGTDGVTVVSGTGSQAVRVPEDCADRVEEEAGLDTPAPQSEDIEHAPDPDETETPDPGPGAPNQTATADDETPGRPAGRAADRPVKRGGARRSKEG